MSGGGNDKGAQARRGTDDWEEMRGDATQYYNDHNDRYRNDPDNYLHYGGGGGSGFFEGIKSFCEKLFGNPGKTLQWFAIVDFIGLLVTGVVCAFVLPYDRHGDFEFWKAVGYVIGGFAGGYITAVPTYAFGSFVNDTAENKATLLRIEKHLKQTNSCIDNINKHIAEEKKQQNSEE